MYTVLLTKEKQQGKAIAKLNDLICKLLGVRVKMSPS